MDGDAGKGMNRERILDEAVTWHVRLASPQAGEATFDEFAGWIESSPEHRAAYDQIEGFEAKLRDAVAQEQVSAPRALLSFRSRQHRGVSPSVTFGLTGLAALAAALLIFFLIGTGSTPSTRYSTDVGQSRAIVLSDGSNIEMGPATVLSAQVGAGERVVRLERGEATFRVRHQAENPFVVQVGDREIRDLGTVFDVRRVAGGITVAVAEGQVAVVPAAGGQPVILRSGDRLRHIVGNEWSDVDKVDPRWVVSWQKGFLIYRDAPLAQVVADLNRYFRTRIVVDDAVASRQRFSGILHVVDEDTAISQLTDFLPVVAVHDGGTIRLRGAKARR